MASNTTQYIGAIDQGTTSTRFILFDKTGALIVSHQVPLPNIFPNIGWQEQNPNDIYQTVIDCMQGVLDKGYSVDSIASIGITNQRETTVVWNRLTGKPYYNAIAWCDTRTELLADEWIKKSDKKQDLFRDETGLPISTYFSALKIQWLLQNVPEFAADITNTPENVCIGTVDTWLLYRLTGEFKTDVSNASRTLLFNIKELKWDLDICSKFGLQTPLINLPPIYNNCAEFGVVYNHLPFGGVKINGILGDQQASLFGFGCLSFGEVKNTYGTGCFLLMNTGPNCIPSKNGLLTTVGFQLGIGNKFMKDYQTGFIFAEQSDKNDTKINPLQIKHFHLTSDEKTDDSTLMPPSHHESDQDLVGDVCYALEGSVASCGSLLTWLISSMKIAESPEQICNFALDVENNADLVIVPAFTGLLAPYWCLDARGIIIGITRYCTNKHLCRAVLESIAMQTCDVVEAMKHDVIENTRVLKPFVKSELHLDSNSNDINNNGNDHCVDLYAYDNIIKNLKVDGGVTQSNFLCAVQSDVLNIPVYRAIMQERTALGAALAAGLGSGFYEGLNEIKELVWDGTCGIDLAVANDLKNAGVCPDIYKPDAQFSGFYEYFPAAGKRHENLPKFMRKWKVAIEKSKGWATIE